ncbi:MAG: hypothetical protein RR865_05040, partial [Clostridia bacterium]
MELTLILVWVVGLAIFLVINVLIAGEFANIAEEKGFERRRYWHFCFWLSFVGYLIVIALPNRKLAELSKALTELKSGDHGDAAGRVKETYYAQAEALLASGEYEKAVNVFFHAGNYRDALKRGYQIIYHKTVQGTLSAGRYHTIGLRADGKVVAVGDHEDGQCDVGGWRDIVAVAAGGEHNAGLCADGTVVAVGDNEEGQCDVSGWTDIVAVAAGWRHTVGLRADGTVVAVGDNGEGQCGVSDWTDIVAVAAGGGHTVGLRADGTVVAVGYNEDGHCDVSDWKDIVAVAAG